MYTRKLRIIFLALILTLFFITVLIGCENRIIDTLSSNADTIQNAESSENIISEQESTEPEESYIPEISFVTSEVNISDDEISFDENFEVDYQDSIVVIADGLLLGGYHDGLWRQEYTYGELLSYSKYYNYNKQEYLGEQDFLAFQSSALIPYYDKIIETYASQVNSEYSKFDLPVKVKGRAATITLTDYNPYVDDYFIPFKTNSSHNALPRTVTKIDTFTDEMIAAVRTTLDENGLTKAAVNITEAYECDLEGNGVVSQVIVAELSINDISEPTEEQKSDEYGTYFVCLAVTKTTIKTIYSEYNRFDDWDTEYLGHYFNIDLIGIYDVNDNGNYEAIISHMFFEGSGTFLFALSDENTWEKVLMVYEGY